MIRTLLRSAPSMPRRWASAVSTPPQLNQATMPHLPLSPCFNAESSFDTQVKAATPAQRFTLPDYYAAMSELTAKGLTCPGLTWDQRAVWGDHDQFGHVNHVRFIQWFESARAFYFEQVFGPESIRTGAKISMILGHINVRYRRPVEQPDTIIIGQGAVMPMERSDRFVLRSTAYSLKQRTIVASADQLCVTYDYSRNGVTDVPADIKARLEQNSLPVM